MAKDFCQILSGLPRQFFGRIIQGDRNFRSTGNSGLGLNRNIRLGDNFVGKMAKDFSRCSLVYPGDLLKSVGRIILGSRKFRVTGNSGWVLNRKFPVPNGQKTVNSSKGYKYPFFLHQPAQALHSLSPPLKKASLTLISLHNHSIVLKLGESKEKAEIYKLTKEISFPLSFARGFRGWDFHWENLTTIVVLIACLLVLSRL